MRLFLIFFVTVICIGTVRAQKPRLIVIGQDPDDAQSLVRLLHYANEFDLQGIIANADSNYAKEAAVLRPEIIHEMIKSYAEIYDNLVLHYKAYPTGTYLHSLVKNGTFGNGVEVLMKNYIGEGKDTEASDWIIEVVDIEDSQPVHITVWGGACDLVQVLWKIQSTRSEKEEEAFVKKLRMFFIDKQDSSNQWVMDTFPQLWLVLASDAGVNKWEFSYRGMFWGGEMETTSKAWLHETIIGQNVLADHYPYHAYTGGEARNPYMALKEGDTPAFLYFLQNGLNVSDRPEWGGRYELKGNPFYTDAKDAYFDAQTGAIINSPRATAFRWRNNFQNDFAARVQWGTKNYGDANHPHAVINGQANKSPLQIKVKAGDTLSLDASKSSDIDNDNLRFEWLL